MRDDIKDKLLRGRDPFVHQRARAEAARRTPAHRRRPSKVSWRLSALDQRRKNQNLFLGLLFTFFAIFVLMGSQAASPAISVQLNMPAGYPQYKGTVIVDGAEVGKTGEVIKKLKTGEQRVSVNLELPGWIVEPESIVASLSYSLVPKTLFFDVKLDTNSTSR
jgi:hypothetical protein